MLEWYATCKLTAQQFCTACDFCYAAGVRGGAFELYRMPPGKETGAYQKRLDRVLPPVDVTYDVPTPVNLNYFTIRTTKMTPVKYGWKCIEDELKSDPTILETLMADPGDRKKSVLDIPAYCQHPVVVTEVSNGRPKPLPVGIYLDGIRYLLQAAGRQDTVLGVWLINLVSGKRHLLCSQRSSDTCLCGCRGWDSLYPLLLTVQWMLRAMTVGKTPPAKHDGTEWGPDDPYKDPQDLSTKSVLVWIKGDWMEHSKSLGLPSWQSYHNPCQFCRTPSTEIHDFIDSILDPGGIPWIDRRHEDYEETCQKCEKTLTIRTVAERTALVRAMEYLKGDKGRGRTIVVDEITIGGVRLRKGDRLDPSPTLVDPGKLEITTLPVVVTFWRTNRGHGDLPLDSLVHRTAL